MDVLMGSEWCVHFCQLKFCGLEVGKAICRSGRLSSFLEIAGTGGTPQSDTVDQAFPTVGGHIRLIIIRPVCTIGTALPLIDGTVQLFLYAPLSRAYCLSQFILQISFV